MCHDLRCRDETTRQALLDEEGNPICETICDVREDSCSCSVGIGECQNNAIYVCSANRLGLECAAVAGTPSNEQCNQKDDDCDGDVDEHPSDPSKNLEQACKVGVGECERSGQYALHCTRLGM